MFSLVVGGFATPCHRIGECHDRFASNEKGVLFIRSVGGPDTSVRGLAACERAWWLEARGFGGVEGVVLRGERRTSRDLIQTGGGVTRTSLRCHQQNRNVFQVRCRVHPYDIV